MPAPPTNDAFLDMIAKSNLVDRKLVDDALQGQPAFATPMKLAIFLVKKGILTKFQAEQILQGRYNHLSIGKYKILDILGRGGMGAVYLCEHITMRRRVAVKVLPSSKANDPSVVERFFREARAVGVLNHPNIVQAHDVDSFGKTHFLVLEYVEGINLHDLVGKLGPLPIDRSAYYIRQSAEGLQHAFEAGLVHRDIKPANLLLSRQGGIKILDMGLARFFEDQKDNLTQKFDSSAVLGTIDYLAPEQSMDSHAVDIRADIYSLGATLYFLLTGRAPFASGTMAQKLVSINMQEPTSIRELRPEVPEELAKVLARMMTKQADDRFQRPEDVAKALAPWAEKFTPNPEVDFPPSLGTKSQAFGTSTSVGDSENDKTETISKRDSKLSGLKTASAKENSSTQVLDSESQTGLSQRLRRHLAKPRLRLLTIVASCAAVGLTLVICAGVAAWFRSGNSEPPDSSATIPTVASAPSTPPRIALVAHFPLEGGIDDVTGHGHRLFLNNSAFFAKGRTGKVLQCDGKNQYAATSSPVLDMRQPFSVAAWVKYQGGNGKNWHTFVSQDGQQMSGFALQRRGDNQHLALSIANKDDPKTPMVRADAHELLLKDVWCHVVGVCTGTEAKLYVNGRLRDTPKAKLSWNATGPLIIGASKNAGNRTGYCHGQIGDVRLFGSALDAAAVRELYGQCAGLSGSELEPLPAGWSSIDFKKPGRAGQTLFDPINKLFSIWGSGGDIWSGSDQCQFTHALWKGDGEIVAQVVAGPVDADGGAINEWSKTGLMCRDTAKPESPEFTVLVTPKSGVCIQWRATAGGNTDQQTAKDIKAPVWLKLVRKGKRFTGYYSQKPPSAKDWKQVGDPKEISLSDPGVRAGFAISSHDNKRLAWAAFSNVTFLPPVSK